MKPIIYLCIFLLIGMTSCQDVSSLVNSIAEENIVECEAIGIAGSPSSLYKKFELLKSKASKEELIQLMNHDSLAVVGYSSYALIDRDIITPSKLLERFLNQEGNVSTFCGCIMDEERLSSLIYHRYWNTRIKYPDDEEYENYIISDSKELQKMDSLILYSKNPYWLLLSRAFENRVYPKEYKFKIEEWAFSKRDYYALNYVFTNLLSENKERLEFSLKEYIAKDKPYKVRKEEIMKVLKDLK